MSCARIGVSRRSRRPEGSPMSALRRPRRLWLWIGGVVAAVLIVGVGGPYVYIHFIEGSAAAPLTVAAGATASSAGGSEDGNWTVGSGSQAGYRVARRSRARATPPWGAPPRSPVP